MKRGFPTIPFVEGQLGETRAVVNGAIHLLQGEGLARDFGTDQADE
jgi:hypothetical protein